MVAVSHRFFRERKGGGRRDWGTDLSLPSFVLSWLLLVCALTGGPSPDQRSRFQASTALCDLSLHFADSAYTALFPGWDRAPAAPAPSAAEGKWSGHPGWRAPRKSCLHSQPTQPTRSSHSSGRNSSAQLLTYGQLLESF